jgi:hypothetical protein
MLDYRGRVCVDDEMRAIPKEGETSNFVYSVGKLYSSVFVLDYFLNHHHSRTSIILFMTNLIENDFGKYSLF